MPDASAPIDPSRHTPEAAPASDPIPIPEADRSRKARTVRIQDILAAHARALDVRLEEGMREMRLAMESAIRRSSIQEAPQAAPPPQPQIQAPPAAPPPPPAPAPEAPSLPRDDLARGLAQQTEERFQSLALRLQRIEDAVRSAALAGGDAGELGSKLEALTDGMNRVASTEEDLFDRLLDAQREGLDDLTRRVGAGVAAVIRAMQTELNATITRLELTADASAAVSPGDTARLERTMMAIAEHQEAVLDDRLTELRESMVASFQETEETAAEVEAALQLDEKTKPEGPRLTVEDAFPWPEPGPEEPLADEAVAVEEASIPDTETDNGQAAVETAGAEKVTEEGSDTEQPSLEESPEAEPEAEVAEAADAQEEPQVGEASAVDEEPAAEDQPAPKKRRRRKRKQSAKKD